MYVLHVRWQAGSHVLESSGWLSAIMGKIQNGIQRLSLRFEFARLGSISSIGLELDAESFKGSTLHELQHVLLKLKCLYFVGQLASKDVQCLELLAA